MADEGEILIGGKNVNNVPPEKRNTAMCFQSYALFPHLNVSHNICYGLKQRKIDIEEQKQRLDLALKQMDLEFHKLKLPNELSGGQQQRVALARAMVTRPDVILFDEPLSNLDAKLRESVRFEIKQLSKQYNLTSIYVTHDQAEALTMSDKIIVLNKGAIEQIGSPQDIYHHPKNRFVADFIGIANITEANVKTSVTIFMQLVLFLAISPYFLRKNRNQNEFIFAFDQKTLNCYQTHKRKRKTKLQ